MDGKELLLYTTPFEMDGMEKVSAHLQKSELFFWDDFHLHFHKYLLERDWGSFSSRSKFAPLCRYVNM